MTLGELTIRNILAKGGRVYGGSRPRNPRMQVVPAWYSKALKGCGGLATRLATNVLPWYADDEGYCGRLTGAQLAEETGVTRQLIWMLCRFWSARGLFALLRPMERFTSIDSRSGTRPS